MECSLRRAAEFTFHRESSNKRYERVEAQAPSVVDSFAVVIRKMLISRHQHVIPSTRAIESFNKMHLQHMTRMLIFYHKLDHLGLEKVIVACDVTCRYEQAFHATSVLISKFYLYDEFPKSIQKKK
jgi:hypothetical protein